MKLHLKKLNQQGFDHVLLALAFVVVIAIGGSYAVIKSRANAWSGALSLGTSNSGWCMEASPIQSGGYVVLDKCNNQINQKWTLQSAGTAYGFQAYTIQNAAAGTNACVDDWQQSTAQGKNNLLRLYTCSTGDAGERFFWSGGTASAPKSQLQLASGTGLCIDDLGANQSVGNALDMYGCKSGSGEANQDWIEVGNGAAPQSGNPNTVAPNTPPTTATGEVTASVGSNMCVTAGNNATIQTCNGGATQQWGQVGNSSSGGSSTVVLYNTSLKTYLGVSGGAVVDTSSQVNASWTPTDNGDGTNTLKLIQSGTCLNAPSGNANTVLTLATCDPGSANQSFTIPSPYVATTPNPSSGSSGSSNPLAPFTPSSPGTTPNDDILTLLDALDSSGYTFKCSALSPGSQALCEQIFGNGK